MSQPPSLVFGFSETAQPCSLDIVIPSAVYSTRKKKSVAPRVGGVWLCIGHGSKARAHSLGAEGNAWSATLSLDVPM
jgi:hypothetical protein